MSRYSDGVKAEQLAADFLIRAGFAILEKRWRPTRGAGAGEVDLVARHDPVLAFVEVKYRADTNTALEAVTQRQQERLIRAAEAYLARWPDLQTLDVRFDVITVTPDGSITHLPDAFRPGF